MICRYYVAEGVRIYSQETWRNVTGNDGKRLVETYIDEVVSSGFIREDGYNGQRKITSQSYDEC